ncbi:extracellular solute-binding protein [Paenibacillus sp. MWE-103]|uniref:Extracellular solute-binding protein n=1 Tax=Paenibacillus artemisiicola TaxID=1172618 RepID=A0ABS3WGT4_9BACL|nr:extracellular solute-binding protein [Paenibacillus artemisiicola]MBO7747463.1 extracellular solute-binding protein [Paenibacillus artemisiicola]
MKRKIISLGTLMTALLLVATACGSNSGGTAGNQAANGGGNNANAANAGADNGSAGGNAGPDEKITLKMMHLWPDGSNSAQNKMVTEIIKEYEEANPNVTITTEVLENEQYKSKLKVLSASNDLPDVGFTWAAGFMDPYVNGNMFAPVDDLLQGELKDKFVAGTTEAYAFGGKTYALPVELNIVPVYYNKDIFAKYNLQPPKTLDELKTIIKTLSDNKVTPITLGGKDAWPSSFWYMYLADRIGGPDVMDKAVAGSDFGDPSLLEAAKQAQELVNMNAFVKGYNGLSNDEAKSLFMNEQAAMFAMGTWEVPNYTTSADVPQAFKDKIGYFKFPAVDGGKGSVDDWVGGPGVGLFVSQNSKHVDEAKKFVSFFVRKWGEHSVTDAGVIPATKVDTSSVKLPQMFIDLLNELNQASKVTLYLDTQMKPGASDAHHNLVQALLGKAVTPEEFIKKQDDALKAGK